MQKILVALAFALLPVPLAAKAPAAPAPGIVSAADPRAAAAGAEILKQGGTATDAAIATMLVLNVVEPQNSGIGGGSFMVYHDAKSGKTITLDGREAAPHAADPKWFYGDDGKPLSFRDAYPGGRSVGVPGNLRMMALAHRRYGKLPWASLFAPAIRYARDGFTVSPRMHNGLELYGRHVEAWGRAHMFTPEGHAVAVGSVFKNPEQAALFEGIAQHGAESFYTGPTAQKIVAAVNGAERNRSKMTLGDLASYDVKDRASICGTYRRYKICGMGPPSSGGISVLMILKQLERFDMAKLGRASPVAWHLFAESSRLAYADRDMYIGDPDYVQVPVAGLLDPKYIAARSALISPEHSLATIAPGVPAGAPKRLRAPLSEVPGTSDLAAADAAGNVIEVTTTIDGYFGSGISVDGVWLNNELTDFDIVPEKDGYLVANRVEGGKRPRSSMSPTIVYGPDGKVRLAIGAAGGSTIIAQVAKAIIGVIDWKLSAQDAIAMGLVYAPGKSAVIEAGTELETMVPALQALGEDAKVGPLGLKANAVERIGSAWVGAADPRSEGVAVATDGSVTRIARRANELNGAHE
ncbi:gamma-glutamyltransferase [Sphingomonas sp. NFR15]|uniref:gamma-glutamyltransferase n=1 Tax=Sphingomonas sp. NFR15 TaxID=1566282 RepID=UPI00088D11B6|nr:gamma-glutamyltransferase [Sphingomonas sp. NFR15]SDA27049.1 gamma-glutamyltranspeptidase / glutathione hydrolase [Sphingomonas sp. NFR15]